MFSFNVDFFCQDSERRERLLLEAKKLKEKAEKKRLKKKVLLMITNVTLEEIKASVSPLSFALS